MPYTFASSQILLLAAEVELASAAFYRNLSAASDGLPAGAVFATLSGQEAAHERSFRAMAKTFKARDVVHEYSIDLYADMKHTLENLKSQAFPEKPADKPQGLEEALLVALAAEESAVTAYTHMRDAFSADYEAVLDGIIHVENDHYRMVRGLKERLDILARPGAPE